MTISKLPTPILKFLHDQDIRIGGKVTYIKEPVGDRKDNYTKTIIPSGTYHHTIKSSAGVILIEEFNGSLRVIKNTLTDDY